MNPAAHRIPAELKDAIVDYCHADKLALKTFSLVCRSWLLTTRYHLFANVFLGPRNAPAFIETIHHPLCTFLSHVRTLDIEEGWDMHLEGLKWVSHGVPKLRRLSKVQALSLRNINYSELPTLVKNSLPRNFGHLTSLSLWRLHFRNFEDFASLVSGLTHLDNLCLDFVVWDESSISLSTTRYYSFVPPRTLRSLALAKFSKLDVLEWLLAHDRVCSSLMLFSIDPDETPVIGRYLKFLGPSLKELTLQFVTWPPGVPEAFYQDVDLRLNCELRSIFIDLHVIMPSCDLTSVTGLLSQINGNQMKDVQFDVGIADPVCLEPLEWEALDRALAKFGDVLSKLSLKLYRLTDVSKMRSWIAARFPLCDQRGVLQVIGSDIRGGLRRT